MRSSDRDKTLAQPAPPLNLSPFFAVATTGCVAVTAGNARLVETSRYSPPCKYKIYNARGS
ncbi:hypothetical protein CKA32_000739 [Geitlerinema sp. FC II]|nr:hypothetical protein CKA32_000739 [Geitlerinema sp. FC II]